LTKPSIAVVVVSFKRQGYLRGLLESLLAQEDSYPFELVIMDNGSTSPIKVELNDILNQMPGIVTVLREEQNLVSPVRWQQAVSAAKSDFILLPGDDDIVLPNYIGTMRNLASRDESVSLISSSLREIDGDGRELGITFGPPNFKNQQEALAGLLSTASYPMVSSGFRKDAFDLSKAPRTRTAFDWWIWMSCWLSGSASVTDEQTVLYRQHLGQERRLYSSQAFRADAARMLTSIVASDQFARVLQSWNDLETEQFVDLILSSGGPIYGDTRWAPMVQMLLADKFASLGAEPYAALLHAQASAQAGIIPELGALQAMAGSMMLTALPEVTWARVPIRVKWISNCKLTLQWNEYLNIPKSELDELQLIVTCQCDFESSVRHVLRMQIQRKDTQITKTILIDEKPSPRSSFELFESLGTFVGRAHGFELVTTGEERVLSTVRKLRMSKVGSKLERLWQARRARP